MDGLKKVFNWAVKGALMIAVTEIIIFTLVHTNPAWMAVMYAITPTINAGFDMTGITNIGWWLASLVGAAPEQMANALGGAVGTVSNAVSGAASGVAAATDAAASVPAGVFIPGYAMGGT